MAKQGIGFSHKCLRTMGNENCYFHIYCREVGNNHPFSSGQQDHRFESSEDGRRGGGGGGELTASNWWI